MVLFSRASFQIGPMAKEVNSNSPPGVFQLFNENRTFLFESDISSLPNPPSTLPDSSTASTMTVSKSWKSLSQPNLSVASSHCTSVSKPTAVLTPANLHLPAAIMAPTTSGSHFHGHYRHNAETGSAEGHYHTDPSYNSSGILKSFKHELHLFSHKAPRQTVSNPSTPRRGSSPELLVDVAEDDYRQRANSDPRKLSLVPEERGQGIERSDSRVSLPVPTLQPTDQGCPDRSRSLSSELDYKERSMSPTLQLTKKVKDWFHSPQSQIEVNKQELNAFSPSSF